ncbi:MAG: N-acetyltransferase [Alphaproteobacteria bacterium]|nr:N-acetyltransferase [Alphaproteobacteria bacterium]
MTSPETFVRVRRADFNDAGAIGRVHIESWRSSYRGILPGEYLDGMSDVRHAAMWSDVLNKQPANRATFVADSNSEGIVGFADCAPERSGIAQAGEITAIYLLPAWQRKGLGRGLVANAARHLAAHEFEHLVIRALRENPWRKFYETIGGTLAGERDIKFAGENLKEVNYVWNDIAEILLIDFVGAHRQSGPA